MSSLTSSDKDAIKIKGNFVMYIWMFLFIFGGLIACVVLIQNGLKFESNYALIYLGGGLLFFPFFLYEAIWALPSLAPGKVLFTIIPGEKGKIVSKKREVQFSNIKNIDYKRNPINLFNEIHIETFDNKRIKFITYNLLHEVNFYDIFDEHVYPHLEENAKKVWDRKITNDQLLKSMEYERRNHDID
ncbi:DUF5381 family protein [Metabacillus indicus]|uniref:DUF5381 family protein n=1 Tax=Metabacillus indicus TaxID=246786 RepID=UPI00049345AC|nr:DUF5381 family protein [Metabacillus indicus]KEZ48153.1 hypothetical protein AZ46_0219515 [Metabacillus indicus LMG 22858]